MPFLLLYTVAEISLGPLFHPLVHTQLVLYLGFRCLCVLNNFVNLFSPYALLVFPLFILVCV